MVQETSRLKGSASLLFASRAATGLFRDKQDKKCVAPQWL